MRAGWRRRLAVQPWPGWPAAGSVVKSWSSLRGRESPGWCGPRDMGMALGRSGDRMLVTMSVSPGPTGAHPQASSLYPLPGSGAARRSPVSQHDRVQATRAVRAGCISRSRWPTRCTPFRCRVCDVQAGDGHPGQEREPWPGSREARQLPVPPGEAGRGALAHASGSRVPSMAAWATSVRRWLPLRA
jgi:hypothetical protein